MHLAAFIVVKAFRKSFFIFLRWIYFGVVFFVLSDGFAIFEPLHQFDRSVCKPSENFSIAQMIPKLSNPFELPIFIVPLLLAFLLAFGKMKSISNLIFEISNSPHHGLPHENQDQTCLGNATWAA